MENVYACKINAHLNICTGKLGMIFLHSWFRLEATATLQMESFTAAFKTAQELPDGDVQTIVC